MDVESNYTIWSQGQYNFFLTLILRQFPSSLKMILKLVYGKEIHIYDLKAQESLSDVCEKIRDMFKKLPDQFILTYKNAQQLELLLNTNQQFDELMEALKNEFKTVRLFITAAQDVPSKPAQTKSEQVIDTKVQQQTYQNTQKIQNVRQLEQWTEKFTNLNEMQQELQKLTQDYQNLQKSQSEENQGHDQNDKTQTTKEFQSLSLPQNQFIQPSDLEERQVPSQRELHVNIQESSDPQDLIKFEQSTNKDLKEKFDEIRPSKQERVQNPQIVEPSQKEQDLSGKQEFKPSSQQKIMPLISQKMVKQDPIKVEQVQDDFRSHNAKCDICNAFPIYGVRYQCVLCQNYDLCEKCEDKFSHEHPLLKICFTYQTPIKIDVEIPQFSKKLKDQQQVVLEKVDLSDLNQQQRKERTLALASQISELLDSDFQQCANFINANQEYTKETLIQLFIHRKYGGKDKNKLKTKNNQKHVLGGIFGNIKNFFAS